MKENKEKSEENTKNKKSVSPPEIIVKKLKNNMYSNDKYNKHFGGMY